MEWNARTIHAAAVVTYFLGQMCSFLGTRRDEGVEAKLMDRGDEVDSEEKPPLVYKMRQPRLRRRRRRQGY